MGIEIAALIAGLFAVLMPLWVDAPVAASVLVQKQESAQATILFGGDMMFDRTVRTTMEREGDDFILSCITETLEDADLIVANLEGPITPNASKSAGSVVGAPENFVFTFPLSVASLLARHNITMVNLGNNHIMNFGEDGVRETMVALSDAGVGFFGSPLMSAFVRKEVSGVPIEFVSYNEFGGSGAGVAVHQIEYARREGYLPIVYAHWGDEYATTSVARQQALAHSFVDAGAAIVIGSHPHVVQEKEFYRGVPIYYSLGNFVFDQYWNEDVRTGLLVRVIVDQNGVVGIDEIPISLESDRRTCVSEDDTVQ